MQSDLSQLERVAGAGGLSLELLGEPARQPSVPRQAPLLFVHGAFAGAWMWRDNYLPYFAGLGYDSFALSLRGHGGSEGRDGLSTTTLYDYVSDVKTVAAQFTVPPVLVGHSMGGLVVDMALRSHVKSSGAVLLAAVPPTGMGPAVMHALLADSALVWQVALLQTMGPSWVNPQIVQQAVFFDPPGRKRMLEYFSLTQPEAQFALAELALPCWPSATHRRVPIGVVGAEQDAIVLPWMVRATAAIHGVEPFWIPGAGHATMLEGHWTKGAEVVTKCLDGLGLK